MNRYLTSVVDVVAGLRRAQKSSKFSWDLNNLCTDVCGIIPRLS